MIPAPKEYIGDGVYAEFDGRLWLTVEDGIHVTERICLEYEVYIALVGYVSRLRTSEPKATAP